MTLRARWPRPLCFCSRCARAAVHPRIGTLCRYRWLVLGRTRFAAEAVRHLFGVGP